MTQARQTPEGTVTADLQGLYQRQGFVELGPILDSDEIDALRRELLANKAKLTENSFGVLHHNLWKSLPGFSALIHDGRLAAFARSLLGKAEVLFFQDNLVWKPPGTKTRLEWHQDFSYWPLSEPDGVTMWLALDDVDEANGCLSFIPGTHLEGECRPAEFVRGSEQPQRQHLPPLDWARRQAEAVSLPVRAGSLVAHHPLVWHMSPGNPSDRQRRAFTSTWVTKNVRWDQEHAPHPYNLELNPRTGDRLGAGSLPGFEATNR